MVANQIVKGIKAGTFVILSLREFMGVEGAQLKPVNPRDHQEAGPGELWLPLSALVEI